MKKICALLALFVGLYLAAASLIFAQPMPLGVDWSFEDDEYIVRKADTLFALDGIYREDDPKLQELVRLNPVLRGPRRIFERDGLFIVLIKPGERLKGLRKLGILPTITPLENLLKAAQPPAPPPITNKTLLPEKEVPQQSWRTLILNHWPVFLTAVLALAALLIWMNGHRAVVPGGNDRVVVPPPAPTPPPAEQPAAVTETAKSDPQPPPAAPIPLHPGTTTATLDGVRVIAPAGTVIESAGGEITLTLQRSGEVHIKRVAARRGKSDQSPAPPVKSVA